MLGHVVLVGCGNLQLHVPGPAEVGVVDVGLDNFGHPADVVVLAEVVFELRGEGLYQLPVARVHHLAQVALALGVEELSEAHGMEVEHVHLADREASAGVDRKPEERPCCGDGEPPRVLAEVLQGRDCLRALLDLVEHHKGLAGRYRLPRLRLEREQEPVGVVAALELLAEAVVVVEVHVRDVLELLGAELLQQPRLTNLSRPVEDEGLAPRGVLPGDEVGHEESIHNPPPNMDTSLLSPTNGDNKDVFKPANGEFLDVLLPLNGCFHPFPRHQHRT